MSALTPPPMPTSPSADLPDQLAIVSRTFARLFGARWHQQGSDPKTLATWERALAVNGISPAQIQRGLRAATALAWPPTCGEFIALCRDPEPALDAAIAEATRWARTVETHDGAWSHPAIGAAARKVGDYALRHKDERTIERIFGAELRRALEAHYRGEQLDLPVRRLAHDTRPRPQGPDQVQRARGFIADLQRHFGVPAGEG